MGAVGAGGGGWGWHLRVLGDGVRVVDGEAVVDFEPDDGGGYCGDDDDGGDDDDDDDAIHSGKEWGRMGLGCLLHGV